jgi:hypothetical protein
MAWTWGKPPPSPLIVTMCLSTRPTSKWHFVLGLPHGVPKFPKLGFLQIWGPITLCADLWLRCGSKKSCIPCQKLFNGKSHATCTKGNRVNYWLLVVGSQTTNLTHDMSFGHNLCFKCPNGSCKPILDIYISIVFQWYNNSSIQWVLTSAIALWKFGSPLGL